MTDSDRAGWFLRTIFETEDAEIDCGQLLEILAEAVDVTVAGGNPADIDPGVPVHLRMCPECAHLYESLLVVARMEADGQLPATALLWSQLERATGVAAPAEAGAADPPPVATTVPPAERRIPVAATPLASDAPGWRERLASFRWGPALAGAAAVVALTFGLAWHQTKTREASLIYTMEVVSRAKEMRSARMADGATLKVLFNPAGRAFVVSSDALAEAEQPPLRCWLESAAGQMEEAGVYDTHSPTQWAWWAMRATKPMSEYVNMRVTAGADQHEVATVALK